MTSKENQSVVAPIDKNDAVSPVQAQNETEAGSAITGAKDPTNLDGRPFKVDIRPLQLRGTLTGTILECQVYLATGDDFYPLGDLNGDLAEEPITREFKNLPFYAGNIVVNKEDTNLHAKVNWKGVGLKADNQAVGLLN